MPNLLDVARTAVSNLIISAGYYPEIARQRRGYRHVRRRSIVQTPVEQFDQPSQPEPPKEGPNPTLCHELDIDDIDKYKKLDCQHYDDCLTIAGNRNYIQFTCNNCTAYSSVYQGKDLAGLIEMARRIFGSASEDSTVDFQVPGDSSDFGDDIF